MKLQIDGLEVIFPFDSIYEEQLDLMFHVKQALDNKTQAMFEMPTGTGKTMSLLAVIVAYQKAYPTKARKERSYFSFCSFYKVID
jgi:DNA excision repair protein ERCC-2